MAIKSRIDDFALAWLHSIELKSAKNPLTNVYGLSRSILALGTLLTLLFNPIPILFIHTNFVNVSPGVLKEVNLFYLLGFHNLAYSKLISIIILIAVISGSYPRLTGILHWWVSFSFFNAAIMIDGGDQITQILTFLYIPLTLVDSRINHWNKPKKIGFFSRYISLLVIFLIQIQIAVVYFNSAVAKFSVPEWLDGTVMYYWIIHNTFGAPHYLRAILVSLVNRPVIVLLMTWGTIVLEVLLFASVFMQEQVRIRMLKAGLIFHFLIFVILGLGSFFFAMSGSLIIYLYPANRNLSQWSRIILRSKGSSKSGSLSCNLSP